MKRNNIIFIALFILIFIIIGLLNYFADPFDLFNEQHTINTCGKPRNLLYIDLKMHKKALRKNDTLWIGGSEMCKFSCAQNHFNVIGTVVLDYENMYNIIKNYLEINPNTKQINILLSYNNFYSYDKTEFTFLEYNGPNITLKELFSILYSKDALYYTAKVYEQKIKSLFGKLKPQNLISFKSHPQKNVDNSENINIEDANLNSSYIISVHPKYINYLYNISEEQKKENEKNNFLYLSKIIKLLKEKNIEYNFVIIPYNAVFLNFLEKKYPYNEMIDNLKKFMVNNVDTIYDFAFVNKYTKANLLKEGYLYSNMSPNDLLLLKVIKVFYDPENAESDIYLKLNKQNVNEQIEYEAKLLNKFIIENSDLINYYSELNKNFDIKNQNFKIDYTENELPLYAYKELQYFRENDF